MGPPFTSTRGQGLFAVHLLCALLAAAQAYPWETCHFLPTPGCSCWDPDRPTVTCTHLNLTQVPTLMGQQQDDWPMFNTLDLSYNNFGKLSDFSFQGLQTRHLSISHNQQVLQMESNTFQGLLRGSLLSLDLSSNGLTHVLTNDNLRSLPSLEELDLSHNSITNLTSLQALAKLKRINLEGNPLVYISPNGFTNHSLEELKISFGPLGSHTPLELLSSLGTGNLGQLNILELTDSAISRMYYFNFRPYSTLQSLSIVRGNLTHRVVNKYNIFYVINRHLRTLSLAENKLTYVPNSILYGLHHLHSLNLSQNQIRALDHHEFRPLRRGSLEFLDLSGNSISSVSSPYLLRLRSLQTLKLNDNHIKSLSPSIMINQHINLYLGNNKWECNCSIWWLIQEAGQELYEHKPGPLSLYDISHDLTCAAPADYYGSRLVDLYMHSNLTDVC